MISRMSSGDKAQEVDHVLGPAGEFVAQFRVLGRHAHRTGIEVADPHHNATHRHQRRGREAKFLGTEQRGDDHVAPGLELAVGLRRRSGLRRSLSTSV